MNENQNQGAPKTLPTPPKPSVPKVTQVGPHSKQHEYSPNEVVHEEYEPNSPGKLNYLTATVYSNNSRPHSVSFQPHTGMFNAPRGLANSKPAATLLYNHLRSGKNTNYPNLSKLYSTMHHYGVGSYDDLQNESPEFRNEYMNHRMTALSNLHAQGKLTPEILQTQHPDVQVAFDQHIQNKPEFNKSETWLIKDDSASQDVYEALGEQDHEEPPNDPDHKSVFHGMATEQQAKDGIDNQKIEENQQLKTKVVKLLEGVKQQIPSFEKIKETDPELFDAFASTVKTLIDLAQKLSNDNDNP